MFYLRTSLILTHDIFQIEDGPYFETIQILTCNTFKWR